MELVTGQWYFGDFNINLEVLQQHMVAFENVSFHLMEKTLLSAIKNKLCGVLLIRNIVGQASGSPWVKIVLKLQIKYYCK